MIITAHLIHKPDFVFPSKDEVMAFVSEKLGYTITQPDWNKIKKATTLTTEVGTENRITYSIDFEATEIDDEEGEQQLTCNHSHLIL